MYYANINHYNESEISHTEMVHINNVKVIRQLYTTCLYIGIARGCSGCKCTQAKKKNLGVIY